MLRLKYRKNTISISLQEKKQQQSRFFLRALGYSLLIHVSMIVFFHIKKDTPPFETEKSSIVFIEQNNPFIDILVGSSEETILQRFYREFSLIPQQKNSPPPKEIALSSSIQKLSLLSLPTIPIVPWEIQSSVPNTHIYPLKIQLSHQLKKLQLIQDGSKFFQKSSYKTILFTLPFAETQPKVEFFIDISSKTGRVIQSICTKELVDKRLQWFAEQLLLSLQFAPPLAHNKSDCISGKLTLQFAGSFDKLADILNWDMIQ